METVKNRKNLETACWQRLKESDREAFRWVYNQYWESLHATAYNFTSDREQSNDLVQDVFVDLWINRDKIDINRAPKAYLKSILKYKVISYLRHLSVCRKEAFLSRVKNELYQEGVTNSTRETVLFNDLGNWLDFHLDQIPEKSRKIFELSRFEDCTNQEIAIQLNISIKTVEYHISKVLAYLKPQLIQLSDSALLLAGVYFVCL